MKISILYGTETGNAEMLADDILAELEKDHDATCANLADTDPASLTTDQFYLLVCSTYGDGELPDSAQPFAEAMEASKPDLTGVHFGIFGLGDMAYEDTFNHGPKQLAEMMQARGATQIGERIAHDASGPDLAEDLAMPWARAVIQEAAGKLSQAA